MTAALKPSEVVGTKRDYVGDHGKGVVRVVAYRGNGFFTVSMRGASFAAQAYELGLTSAPPPVL